MESKPEIKEYHWPERLNKKGRGSNHAYPICYYIDANGCWICVSHKVGNTGYPRLRINHRHQNMHHAIWEYEHKRSVGKGLVIRHLCNNPACINPAHLKEGTVKENYADAIKAGTAYLKSGEAHPQSKLTEANVRFIRANPEGLLQRELAVRFGVHFTTISAIQTGRSWGWLESKEIIQWTN